MLFVEWINKRYGCETMSSQNFRISCTQLNTDFFIFDECETLMKVRTKCVKKKNVRATVKKDSTTAQDGGDHVMTGEK